MLIGIAVVSVLLSRDLEIETVRNMSYQRSDLRVRLRRIKGTTALFYQSKLSCDVDGAPNAYHPLDDRLSLDVIDSAGGKRDGDRPDGALLVQPSRDVVAWLDGKPYVQPDGEFKGFFVSKTSYENARLGEIDPARYLDPRHIQYIVLPGGMVPEAKVGDLAAVYDPFAKTVAYAVFGDVGPTSESGEAAMATLQRLGMRVTDGKSSPGQARDDLFFIVFPGSVARLEQAEAWPHKQETIDALGADELNKWGGVERLEEVVKQDPQGGSIVDDAADGFVYDELAALRQEGLVRPFEFSLPVRCPGGSAGRLPCAPEAVYAAKEGVTAITGVIESVELGKQPNSVLKGMADHLTRISRIFRQFPAASLDVTEGVLRETARCQALTDRILRCLGR